LKKEDLQQRVVDPVMQSQKLGNPSDGLKFSRRKPLAAFLRPAAKGLRHTAIRRTATGREPLFVNRTSGRWPGHDGRGPPQRPLHFGKPTPVGALNVQDQRPLGIGKRQFVLMRRRAGTAAKQALVLRVTIRAGRPLRATGLGETFPRL
jgi:hypothetical protein